MKLPELKEKLKNKYTVRIVAGVLSVALLGGGIGSAVSVNAAKNDKTKTTTEASNDDEDVVDDLLGGISSNDELIDKDESVYLISDASGNVEKTIVSDHLYNRDGAYSLTDKSNLSDITNTKGDEEFTQDGDSITWKADGNDIYYQGTSSAKAPVTQKVTYYLDGKEISPEDLAGQSGKVTIHFDYENTTTYTETVNGEEVTVVVPFAAVTALMLDDNFTNVEVTNGKVENSGDNNLVIGYALPGVSDSLETEDGDLDVDLPEYFEVTADVKDFKLATAMTIVSNASDFITSEGSSTDSLDDMISDLSDASKKLEDGSSDLSDGVGTLQDKMGDFSDGVSTLKKGLNSYLDGAKSVNDGIGSLKAGIEKLSKGSTSLGSGVKKLADGADSAVTGAKKLVAGYEGTEEQTGLVDGAAQVAKGASDLATGASSLSEGAAKLDAGVDTLAATLASMRSTVQSQIDAKLNTATVKPLFVKLGFSDGVTTENLDTVTTTVVSAKTTVIGALQLSGYSADQASATYDTILSGLYQFQGAMSVVKQLEASGDSIKELAKGTEDLKNGAADLAKGSSDLAKGSSDLATGAGTLSTGANTVSTGVSTVAEGTKTLEKGLETISGGLTTLNNSVPTLTDGITKLSKGANTLNSGSNKLVSNNEKLSKGASSLADGTDKIVDGVDKLADGSKKLADGMVEFNEEGINKIVNSYNGDLKPLTNRLQALLDAGADYQTFTDIADGNTGNVKFIYKLASIESDDAEE